MNVYKITNCINNKIYIGATTLTIEDRFKSHINACCNGGKLTLYKAMRKYGWINFKIELLDSSANTIEELNKLESKYIIKFNSLDKNIGYNCVTNNYTGGFIAKSNLDESDILNIRELYKKCEHGPRYWWNLLYSAKLSYSGFEKIWEGASWSYIMPEVFTKERLEFYKTIDKRKGETNPFAKLSNSLVLEMRKYYVNHSCTEVWKKYADCGVCQGTLFNILRGASYLIVPRYKKTVKKWFLNDKEININDYNPVSTISVSGE